MSLYKVLNITPSNVKDVNDLDESIEVADAELASVSPWELHKVCEGTVLFIVVHVSSELF